MGRDVRQAALADRLRDQWMESAADWIRQDQSVRTGMLDAWVLAALGEVDGRRVLDIGCGEGRFCRLLAGLGAEVVGVDLTAPLIHRAQELGTGGETYLVGNAENIEGIEGESFDLAVSYIVLVDVFDFSSSIKEAWRALRPGGRFVVCNIHPMRSSQPGGWIKQGERKLFYPLDNYMDEGPRQWNWWGRPFINMHRTLSSHIAAFLDAGFVLEGLREPTPSPAQLAENPAFDDEFRAPNFILYLLRKPTR